MGPDELNPEIYDRRITFAKACRRLAYLAENPSLLRIKEMARFVRDLADAGMALYDTTETIDHHDGQFTKQICTPIPQALYHAASIVIADDVSQHQVAYALRVAIDAAFDLASTFPDASVYEAELNFTKHNPRLQEILRAHHYGAPL